MKLSPRTRFKGDGGGKPLKQRVGGGNHADSRRGTEQVAEEQEAVRPTYDQLRWERVDTGRTDTSRIKILSGTRNVLWLYARLGLLPFFFCVGKW